MLEYQTLNDQVRRIVLSTMKDGDKAFNLPKVIEALSHNLNDRRYVAYALAGIGNGHGDISARIKIGHAVIDVDICGQTSCIYYEKDPIDGTIQGYCWNPKRKNHADVKVTFVRLER